MEQGKTPAEAEFEVDDIVRYISYAVEAARRIQGEILPADLPNEQLYIYRVPYGVTLGICAYNYPLALIGRKLGPALVAGNVMIIKPHESTPITASEFCRLVEQAGLPKGVVNMVTSTVLINRNRSRRSHLSASVVRSVLTPDVDNLSGPRSD